LSESLKNINAPLNNETTVNNITWTDDPQDVTEENPYLYQASANQTKNNNGILVWSEYGNVILWSKYGADGNGVESISYEYAVSNSNENVDYDSLDWKSNSPAVSEDNRYLWRKTTTTYQKALKDDEATGEDETAKRTKVTYEMIGAMGEPGIDGASIEWIYTRTETNTQRPEPNYSSYNGKTKDDDDFIPEGWTDDLEDVTDKLQYAWRSQRKKDKNTLKWGDFLPAVCVAKYGMDGIGITDTIYKYAISKSNDKNKSVHTEKFISLVVHIR
jgi:hypothetical protein